MSKMRHALVTLVCVSVGATLLTPTPAQAQYLDPGAGSIIVQAVIAGVIGLAAVLKLYWGKISGLLMRRSKSKSQR
jgi:hypothetical protein